MTDFSELFNLRDELEGTYEMSSLGEDFPKEQARVREVLKHYHEVGIAGVFGATMIEDVLSRADTAVMNDDIVAMIKIYNEMKNIK
jgi:hypothetical protein